MSYVVDFTSVSTAGLESSPVAEALAGLRAHDARYYRTKYDHEYATVPAGQASATLEWVDRILEQERGIVVSAAPLEVADLEVDGIRWPQVYYDSGLAINVLYTLADSGKRAVGFKLSEGMDPPAELDAFKFARQRSKLAGTIRGSYFTMKNEYPPPPLG